MNEKELATLAFNMVNSVQIRAEDAEKAVLVKNWLRSIAEPAPDSTLPGDDA